jgi:hypothetical protein
MKARMIVIMLMMLPALSVTSLSAAEEGSIEVAEFPRFDELLDWVNFVRRDGFVLLKAVKQNDYFVAVFRDKEGDIAICTDQKNFPDGQRRQSSYSITDENGRDVHDISKKVPSLGRSFKKKLPGGGDVVLAILDGHIYAIKKGEYKSLRVTLSAGVKSPDKIIFDETVEYR